MYTLKIQIKPLLYFAIICLACLVFTSGHSGEGRSFIILDKSASDRSASDKKKLDYTANENLDYTAVWSLLLQEMDNLEELIIIERKVVSQGDSDEGAKDEENPCDIIHVTSGLLQEFLIVDSPEFTIIGLPGPDGERVVMIHPGEIVTRITLSCVGKSAEVTEICLEHFHEKSFRICPGDNFSDTTGTPPLTIVRKELSEGLVQYVCELPLRSYQHDLIRIFRQKPDGE
jgi:hypothetical protein